MSRRPELRRPHSAPDYDRPGPRKPKAPLWARLMAILGSIVVVLSGGAVVAATVARNYVDGAVSQTPLLPPRTANPDLNGPQNLILLGMDKRPGNTDLIRADSIIIVHINAAHTSVQLVSIPRDSRVPIPAYPATNYPGGTDKINAAFAFGNRKNGQGDPSLAGRQRGVDLMVKTINQLIPGGGIDFTGAAIIDFTGFGKLVTALGGVDMCIDERAVSLHYDIHGKYVTDSKQVQRYVYLPGCRHLPTWQALDYVRLRDGLPNTDYDRQRHQQQFLLAVFKQLLSKGTLTDPAKLKALQGAAGDFLTLDLGGIDVTDWIFAMKNIRANDIVLVKTNGGKFNSQIINNIDYEVLSDKSLQLLEAVRTDTVINFLSKNPSWVSNAT